MEYSDRAFTTLRGELTQPQYAEMDDQQAADALNATAEVANPTPRPTVPKRLSVEEFVTLLKPADRVTVFQNGALVQEYRAALEGGQRAYSKKLWAGLKTLVTDADSKAAIAAALDATELDQDWQPTVTLPSRAEVLGLGTVTNMDVYRARLGKW